MRGSIGATTPTKTRWSGFMCLRMIFRTRDAILFAGQRDIEIPALSSNRLGSSSA